MLFKTLDSSDSEASHLYAIDLLIYLLTIDDIKNQLNQ